jgi:hypothetical protein
VDRKGELMIPIFAGLIGMLLGMGIVGVAVLLYFYHEGR